MAEILHLTPRQIDRLTVEEFDQAARYLKGRASA